MKSSSSGKANSLAASANFPQPFDVSVSSIPKKDWWERLPVAIGISLLALVLSIVPFVYSTWPAREDAAVAILRWTTPFTPDGTMHPQIWLAVANRGNRDMVVLQSPFMYQTSGGSMKFVDDKPLEDQSEPAIIEPGKSAVIRVSTDIPAAVMDQARMTPNQTRNDEAGSKAVVRLSSYVVAAHPNSGEFSYAMTNCLRVLLYENSPVRAEVDPHFVDLKASVGYSPCLNDSPAPRVAQ